jgi:uncharacterized protein (DUF1501 family)
MQTRRVFLRNAALAMVGAGTAPAWLWRALEAAPSRSGRKKTLVAIFQRGAADGLNIVAPFGEKRYYELRPTIAVPGPSSSGKNAALDLDGFFGLHPSLAPLKPLYDSQHLAIVHAVGSPDPTRSHFDAQDYMESGTPGRKSTAGGWMNRALPREAGPVSSLRAISLGPRLPRAMRGSNPAAAIENLNSFRVRDAGSTGVLETMYAGTTDTVLQGAGRETFEAVKLLESLQREPYTSGAQYPRGPLGENLQQIARLIKAQVGVELAFADVGGWDHHANEVGPTITQGPLANRLRDLGQALDAFWQDLGDHMEDVVLVTMSEFGRTARENGNRGTDHGHANVMFALGGPVRGGKVYGDWPGLAPEQLYEGRDLNLTTDFRDVLGELVAVHLGNPAVGSVFPGYVSTPVKYRRLLRA